MTPVALYAACGRGEREHEEEHHREAEDDASRCQHHPAGSFCHGAECYVSDFRSSSRKRIFRRESSVLIRSRHLLTRETARFDRHDITDQIDTAESSEPTQRNEPSEASDHLDRPSMRRVSSPRRWLSRQTS